MKPCFQRTLLCVIKLLFFPALQSIWPRLKQHLVSSLLPEHPPPQPYCPLCLFSALVHCVHTPGEHQPNSSSAPLVISLSLVSLSERTCDFHSPSRTHKCGGPRTDRHYFIFRRSSRFCHGTIHHQHSSVIAFEKCSGLTVKI